MVTECLERIVEAVRLPCEVLVVYDTPEDTSRPFAEAFAARDPRIKPTLNTYGRGPASTMRSKHSVTIAPSLYTVTTIETRGGESRSGGSLSRRGVRVIWI